MARIYSNHMNTTGVAELAAPTTLTTPPVQLSAGLVHARARKKIARITIGVLGIADEARMMTFRSSDRIGAIFLMCDGASTGTLADLGLYLSGTAHDGAVKDQDLFATVLALDDGIVRTDVFTQSTVCDDEERWKQAWELPGMSYTEDPKVDFDLVLTCKTTALSVAVTEVVIDVDYTSGD